MKRPISHGIHVAALVSHPIRLTDLVNSLENEGFFMRIHPFLIVFMLIFTISCQEPQPEAKGTLTDSAKDLTIHPEIPPTDALSGPGTEGRPERPDSNFIRRKLDKGIDFFATGTEPFWSIDMDFEKQFSFHTMDGFILNTPATEKMKGGNPNVSRYNATTEAGEIIIMIHKKECIDAMSGEKSPYEVTVRVKSSKEKDFTDYKGCGRYTNTSGILMNTGK
jgi:uncharacterized membrane protein